ncbi:MULTISPECIES: hypothetical protein [unclassified Coleofasciculus]|uniref:hypothetical protein n=1 Tax=unclassified Coleofasciculus TaxID=2692782 RepID=UPI00187E9562|nr:MULTISPECIES: hypothetical protein [unclassified Coleofasciculus]MBE9129465.1 hypothetical protein [Coleofasciculus sp. LEGE 07081]MBE9152100.1 hypothetical protein [Coleofasciculus sp. LEGE 07092]
MASFRANLRGDNRQFLERFICLSAALSIRAYLVYFLLAFVARAIPSLIYWAPVSILSFFIEGLASIGVTLYIYIRMRSLIAYVATGRE